MKKIVNILQKSWKYLLISLAVILLTGLGNTVEVKAATTIDGIQYSLNNTTHEAQVYDCEASGRVIIPSTVEYSGNSYTVTSIKYQAFQNNRLIQSVSIPKTVNAVGWRAFCFCASLVEVEFEENSGVVSLEREAFAYCESLSQIKLPENLKAIDYEVFKECTALQTISIPDSVTSIGHDAFVDCKALGKITLPANLNTLGENVFSGCKSLTEAIMQGNKILNLPDATFKNCSALKTFVMPDSITSLGNGCFLGCSKLESLTFSTSLTDIPANMFSGCTKLKTLSNTENIEFIGNSAFAGTGLTEINFPKLSEAGEGAFSNCKSLSTAKLPNTLRMVSKSMFQGCSLLQTVEFGSGMETIGNLAFSDCSILQNLEFPDTLKIVGQSAFYNCGGLQDITFPDTVTSVGDGAFSGCISIKAMQFGTGLTLIPDDLYFGRSGNASLSQVIIKNDSVTFRDDYTAPVFNNNSKKLRIYANPESTAEEFANEEGYRFVPIAHLEHEKTAEITEEVKKEATCQEKGQKTYTCEEKCGYSYSEEIPVKPCEYKTEKKAATMQEDGYEKEVCIMCGGERNLKTYHKITSVTLSSTSMTYRGEELKPSVTVRTNGWNTLQKDKDYTVTYSNNIVPGIGKAVITFQGNYEGQAEREFTIRGVDISNVSVSLSSSRYTYTGMPIEPQPLVTYNGKTLQKDIDYTLSYADNTAVGSARLAITGIGNYTGSQQTDFYIYGIDIQNASVVLPKTSYAYTGRSIEPNPDIICNGKTLKKGADYTVTYMNNMSVGTAEVIVAGMGGYTGSIRSSFFINPKGTKLSKVSGTKKGFTVKWKKNKQETTGYEISYSTSKKFSGAKKKKITKNTTTKYTVKKLKAKKKYYVRIRTYKTVYGKKYYSAWSKAKSVKTKK